MEEYVAIDTWKEEFESFSSEIQPNQFEEEFMKEELKKGIEYVTVGD